MAAPACVTCLLLLSGGQAHAQSFALSVGDDTADVKIRHQRTIRTVEIDMGLIWFHPRSVTVDAGETVRFVLRNNTEQVPHEFTVGSQNMQAGRRELIKEMSEATPIDTKIHNSSPYDAPNAVVVLPGETKELIWTFTSTQRFEFGCNVPGHYEFGMKGAFRLLAAADNELDFPAISRKTQSAPRPAADPDLVAPVKTPDLIAEAEPAPVEDPNLDAPTPEGRPSADTGRNTLAKVGQELLGVSSANAATRFTLPAEDEAAADKLELEAATDKLELEAAADPARQLGAGHKLMAKGYIVQARKLYTESLDAGLSEAALALARSYDPRAISRIDEPDAEPNPDEAWKWYEEWYRRSVDEGAISPAVKLEGLLQAMRR
ncbi:MAG: plastocyanin/azurin family copper-binding protein [Hyphomicrobiales bacterium]